MEMRSNPYAGYQFSTLLMYADPDTKVRIKYLQDALNRDVINNLAYPTTRLITADRYEFHRAILEENPKAIFIPENMGPISYHTRDIPLETRKLLRQYVSDGGKLVLFGAAAHYAMKEVKWFWNDWKLVHRGAKETFAFVNGQIKGPYHRRPLSPYDRIDFQGCFEVPIALLNGTDEVGIEKCWQGNCGTFVINDNRIQSGFSVIARYDVNGDELMRETTSEKSIAAMEVPYGIKGGSFILCSVMPHYYPQNKSGLWTEILRRVDQKMTGTQWPKMLNQRL